MEESSFHQPRFSLSCIRCISASEGSLHSSSVRYFQPEDLERHSDGDAEDGDAEDCHQSYFPVSYVRDA